MIGLVYSSREQVSFNEASLLELAELAAQRNAEAEITGYLYYDKGNFTQYIEGEREAIDRLTASLDRDPRHSIVATFEEEIALRRFNDWSMQLLHRNQLVQIKMEHILTDYLKFASRLSSEHLENVHPLWQMVDAIAVSQNHLVGQSGSSPGI